MARSAATRDPRFPPIRASELDHLSLSVTLLGAPLEWPYPRDPSEIEIGVHGLEVSRDGARGVLLPQVAEEWGYDAVEFLAATCRKAGLPIDAWQEAETDVWRFCGWQSGGLFRELLGDDGSSEATRRRDDKR